VFSIPEHGANAIESQIPKGRPPPIVTVDVQSPRVQGSVERCSRLATAKGVFGDVTVTILKKDPSEPRVSGSSMLEPIRWEIEQCVRESLFKLGPRFYIEEVGPSIPVWPESFGFAIGDVRPLLPPLDVLMPRWVKALDAPPAQSSAPRAALAAILPPGISLRQDGCLAIGLPGPAVFAGLDMWARLSGRSLHETWFRLPFFYWLSPHRPSGVLVLSESEIVFTPRRLIPPNDIPDALCIRRLAPEEVKTVRSQIDQVGTCWMGNLQETLRSPCEGAISPGPSRRAAPGRE